MLLGCFGLSDDPFGVTPEPRFLFHSNTHREALASLKCGFYGNRGFTALIAPPGLGKTTLLQCFLGETRDFARSAFLFNIDGQCEPRELIHSILRDLGITPAETATEMHEQLNALLVEEARSGRPVVIVVDEAQNLSDAALEALRLLSNFETARGKLMHIILAGQPQLSEKLMGPALVQLRQRITTISLLDPLSAEETRAYIAHRLTLAGYCGDSLFTSEAVRLISEASQGIPRMINTLCFNALLICRALNKKQVDVSMVEEAIADLGLTSRSRNETPVTPWFSLLGLSPDDRGIRRLSGPVIHWIWAAAVVVVIGIGVFAFSEFPRIRAHKMAEVQSIESKPALAAAATPVAEIPGRTPVVAVTSKEGSFKIKVAPHQTLRDIVIKYYGEFDENRLSQIRALNPLLTNPNHIVPGQSLWLPGRPTTRLSAMISTNARTIP